MCVCVCGSGAGSVFGDSEIVKVLTAAVDVYMCPSQECLLCFCGRDGSALCAVFSTRVLALPRHKIEPCGRDGSALCAVFSTRVLALPRHKTEPWALGSDWAHGR